MPKQENLKKSAQPVKSAEKQTIKKSDVATVEASNLVPSSPPALIESKEEKKVSHVAIPDFLKTQEMPELSNRRLTGYVGFAHPMSKNFGMMQAAGVDEGMPFLFHQGRFIPAKTLEFFVCRGESFKTYMNDRGKFIFVTRDLNTVDATGPIVGTNKFTNQQITYVPEGGKILLDPHYICLLIVNLNGNLIPIKGDFRGTKSGGIETCIRAVEAAASPEWGKLSDMHKVSMSFPSPFGRVYHVIRTKHNVGKVSGRAYYTANASSVPSNIAQMQLLASAFENEEFNATLAEANANFDKRVEVMDNIADIGPYD